MDQWIAADCSLWQLTDVGVDTIFSTMASSNDTNQSTNRLNEHRSRIGNIIQGNASLFNATSILGNDCWAGDNGRVNCFVSANFHRDFTSTARTPDRTTWSISPLKSSIRQPKANAGNLLFPTQDLNYHHEALILTLPISDSATQPPLPPLVPNTCTQKSSTIIEKSDLTATLSGQTDEFASNLYLPDAISMKTNSTQSQQLLDLSSDAGKGNQEWVNSKGWSCSRHTSMTPNGDGRTWTISPIMSSRRHSRAKQHAYPSQAPNHRYETELLSSPMSECTKLSPIPFRMTDRVSTSVEMPDEVTSMAIEQTHVPSPNIGVRGAVIKAKDAKNDDENRAGKVKSKRSLFYLNASKGRNKRPSATGIAVPSSLDILRGRGGLTNRHEGNLRFREEARKLRAIYRDGGTSRDDKFLLTWELIKRVDEYGGRFLELGADKLWYEMNDRDARKKASQGKDLLMMFNSILSSYDNNLTLCTSQSYARRNGIDLDTSMSLVLKVGSVIAAVKLLSLIECNFSWGPRVPVQAQDSSYYEHACLQSFFLWCIFTCIPVIHNWSGWCIIGGVYNLWCRNCII